MSSTLPRDPRLYGKSSVGRGMFALSHLQTNGEQSSQCNGQFISHSLYALMGISDAEEDGTVKEASRPESTDQTIQRLHSQNLYQQTIIREWERCKQEWVDRFNQQDHKHHSEVQVLSTKVELREKELNQLHLEGKELKSQLQLQKREHRKEIDRIRLNNASQHGQLEALNQKLQAQLQGMTQELKSSENQEVKLQDHRKGSQAMEEAVNLLEAELAALRGRHHIWDSLQTKLDNKVKALRTCMERIRLLDDQLREASKQQAASARRLKEANEKWGTAEAEMEQWKAQYRREEEGKKKANIATVETASNTDACSLSPEYLQQCVEERIKLQQDLKEVCEATKNNNALLLKERQDLKHKEAEWSKERDGLNQQLHTSQANLEKCRADLRVAVGKLEKQEKQKQLEEAAKHLPVSNVTHSPTAAVQPPIKRAMPPPRQSQPKKRRKQPKKGAEPARTCSEPLTLATALKLFRASPPCPKAPKVLGDLIVLSEDEEDAQQPTKAILPSILSGKNQTTCLPFEVDAATAGGVVEEQLPSMMSPIATSPPKGNVHTVVQVPSASVTKPACGIKPLKNLTTRVEKRINKTYSQQPPPSVAKPVVKPIAQTWLERLGEKYQQQPASNPLLVAQQFADHVAQCNQLAEQANDNGRVPISPPACSQADLSHRIRQLFVEYLSGYVAGDAPAWTAMLPFCNQYGVPDGERPQLMRHLQPIASAFDVMKRINLDGHFY